MYPLPHQYRAHADGGPGGIVQLGADALPGLETTAPPEFDGPGGYWSPETLLVGSIANCYILTFRAGARMVWM
jgi:organic hydroperoxide reductase OsmC/OhrA